MKAVLLAVAFFLTAAGAYAQEAATALPTVIDYAVPTYPPLARQVRIQGDVRLAVVTDGERVTEVKVESGHPLLAPTAVENVKTWRFAEHPPTSFQVSFQFKERDVGTPFTVMRLPTEVDVFTTPVPIGGIVYGTYDLGSWIAELLGKQGASEIVWMNLSIYGPWMNGEVVTDSGERMKIKNGSIHRLLDPYESKFEFVVDRSVGNNRTSMVLFKGGFIRPRDGGDVEELVGTFSDAKDYAGTWRAKRLTLSQPK